MDFSNKLIIECRRQAKRAYDFALLESHSSVTPSFTPILFHSRENAVQNFHNSGRSSTERMIYVTGHGWRRVKFGAVFDWERGYFYVELNHERTAVIYTF